MSCCCLDSLAGLHEIVDNIEFGCCFGFDRLGVRLGVGCVLIVCLGLFGGSTALRRLRWFRHLVLIERSVDLVFNEKKIDPHNR